VSGEDCEVQTFDSQGATLPLNLTKAKLSKITCTKPKTRQHQNDGSITQAANGTAATGSDDALYFLCC